MNKKILLKGTHGDRLIMTIGMKYISFDCYTDGSGFVVRIPKEEFKEMLQ